MSDKNKNNLVDPDEAKDIVEEEGLVNEAYLEDKIDTKGIQEIDSLDDLNKKAEQIKMESGMGDSTGFTEIKPEEIKTEEEDIEVTKEDEQPVQPVAPIPLEVTQEITAEVAQEPASEPAQETQLENELSKELKTGI